MPRIGHSSQPIVVRTDFSDDVCWRAVCELMLAENADGFKAYVDIFEDSGFAGYAAEEVLDAVGDEYRPGFLIVGDQRTMTDPEHPLLVLDLVREPGRSFRALPGQIQSIENNLSISNLDFSDFADAAEPDGVYRGFD